jgi:hypothetical protein
MSVFDFKLGDALVVLLHMCRTFPVIITYPEFDADDKPGATLGFLWIPLDQREELERGMREGPKVSWEYVCTDLVNGEEVAFYRDTARKAISIAEVTRRYFAAASRTPDFS